MLHKLPFQVLKPQSQLLIFHIPPAGKKGGVPAASFALKHIIGVRRSGDAGRAGHLVERIVSVLEFSQMMDENNGNIVLICDPLKREKYLRIKNSLHSFGQRVPKCTPISGLFLKNFFEKKFTLHLFGITKPNDTLFFRKTENIFCPVKG